MKTNVQKGFTLVEVIMAAVIGAIVILASGTVLVTSHTFLDRGIEKANLQRDASYAMLRISRSIKAGRSAELESDGKAIKIYRDADWIRFFLDENSSDLKCEIEGEEPQSVITDNVEDLQFNLEGNKVTIDLRLNDDNSQNHFVLTVMMRNYGG